MSKVNDFKLVEHKLLTSEEAPKFLESLDEKARKRHLPLMGGQIAEFTGNLYADTTDCVHTDGVITKSLTVSIELKREDGLIFCVSPTTFCTKRRIDAEAKLITLKGEFADGEIPSEIIKSLNKGQKIVCNEQFISFVGSSRPTRIVTLSFVKEEKK